MTERCTVCEREAVQDGRCQIHVIDHGEQDDTEALPNGARAMPKPGVRSSGVPKRDQAAWLLFDRD